MDLNTYPDTDYPTLLKIETQIFVVETPPNP